MQSCTPARMHSPNTETFWLYTVVVSRLSTVAFACKRSNDLAHVRRATAVDFHLLTSCLGSIWKVGHRTLIFVWKKNDPLNLADSSANVMQNVTSCFSSKDCSVSTWSVSKRPELVAEQMLDNYGSKILEYLYT